MLRTIATLSLLVASVPGAAQESPALADGFAGALRGCEEWVLNPASWSEGPEPFLAKVALGDRIGLVESIAAAQLPPEELRVANHYWRINSTPTAGYALVVSDRLPMCHITGGGRADLQPVVNGVIAGEAFQSRWRKLDETARDGMMSTRFVSVEEPAFEMTVSRADSAGQRQDRVQVLATAMFRVPE
ncbi:MAG: hypothetical protein WA842_04065 [Croceibacterium sp.]